MDFLKLFIASPIDLPSSGSFFGPKSKRAIAKSTKASGSPKLKGIANILAPFILDYYWGICTNKALFLPINQQYLKISILANCLVMSCLLLPAPAFAPNVYAEFGEALQESFYRPELLQPVLISACQKKSADNWAQISCLAKALNDPYTRLLRPEEALTFWLLFFGRSEHTGLLLDPFDDWRILAVQPSSPASLAGIEAGDEVESIGGNPVALLDRKKAASLLGHSKQLRLDLKREDLHYSLRLESRELQLKPFFLTVLSKDTFYLQVIDLLDRRFVFLLKKELKARLRAGQKLIIDLRGVRGGLLENGLKSCDLFVSEGSLAVIGDSGGEKSFLADDFALPEQEIALLVDDETASAAELLAICLRQMPGTRIIGEKTFGKGKIQELHTLSDGATVSITNASFTGPHGEVLDGRGIEPDLVEEDRSFQLLEAMIGKTQ